MISSEDILLDYQLATDLADLPSSEQIAQWVALALQHESETFGKAKELIFPIEMTVRIVGLEESQELNSTYRDKDKPTNVLSFPFENPPGLNEPLPILGDLVVCAEVVAQEADEQNKTNLSHWAHMIVHGSLHLLGYDHINETEALQMESLEIEILKQLSISNPYELVEK